MASPPIDLRGKKLASLESYHVEACYAKDLEGILVTAGHVKDRVLAMARDINQDYAGREQGDEPYFLIVQNGAMRFASNLLMQNQVMKQPFVLDSVIIDSYDGTESTHMKVLSKLNRESMRGRDVVIVEDIVDRGNAMAALIPYLQEMNPHDIKIASLFDKPIRRENDFCNPYMKYVGFTIPDLFIVGYGLDFDNRYRGIPHVGVLKPEVYK